MGDWMGSGVFELDGEVDGEGVVEDDSDGDAEHSGPQWIPSRSQSQHALCCNGESCIAGFVGISESDGADNVGSGLGVSSLLEARIAGDGEH